MAMLDEIEAPDMVLMSPGPGCPKDFKTAETLKHLLDRQLPIFGVCLGLQVRFRHRNPAGLSVGVTAVFPEALA